jgi:hypothetical protein
LKECICKSSACKASRHTPNKVKATDIEQNETISLLQSGYKWAVSEASNFSKKVTMASTASQKFNITIFPQALRNLLREGRDQIMPPGPKPVMNNEDLKE